MCTANKARNTDAKILLSAMAAGLFDIQAEDVLASDIKRQYSGVAIEIAEGFARPSLVRKLRLADSLAGSEEIQLEFSRNLVNYKSKNIGRVQILYKPSLPGELQARLAIESAIDRFLEYLQKVHKIAVLSESDRHVQIFVPQKLTLNFPELWRDFIENVALSAYGVNKYQIPGLAQTFISMLNSVRLSKDGFSTLDIPIVCREQANILAAWYFSVFNSVKRRQEWRQTRINYLRQQLEANSLSEKDQKTKQKELEARTGKQEEELQKYTENFSKTFGKYGKRVKPLLSQLEVWEELAALETKINSSSTSEKDKEKLERKRNELFTKVIFSRSSLLNKYHLLTEVNGNPFAFVELDQKNNPEKFQYIKILSEAFGSTATDQINSSRGDIFTQCLTEMYRLLEMKPDQFDPLPPPLLTEQPDLPTLRSPGDESREFCYSCGIGLNPKEARWQVLRFMFERPSQRRQSASGEGRPHICSSCSALAFASPLKVTEESIILRLDPDNQSGTSEIRIKDYLRMLTSKEMHLTAGRYLVLSSDRTGGGDLASQKLGQVQYALAKVASIFPVEVLTDFNFSLIIQGNSVPLLNRQLLFMKGLMDCYRQPLVIAGKEINMALGDAVRYLQQDLPFLADYTLTTKSNFSTDLKLEEIRALYWKTLQQDLQQQGDSMDSNNQLPKRARLYRDVAALTGLTYAFAQFLESTAKSLMEQEDAEREVSKLIEKVDDAIAFCYYATLGDEKKTSVQARLYHKPDCDFIYGQTKNLLHELGIADRENKDEKGKSYLQFYADDVSRVYQHFATLKDYTQEKDWKELTYNLKLSLYTRFPELVRKRG